MYIEICQDVVEDAIAKSGYECNDSLDLLQLFALFSSKGEHIVTVPCLRKNKELVDQLKTVMSGSNVKKLRQAESIFYILQTIKKTLSVVCLVTYSNSVGRDEKEIVVNPSRMLKFEPFLRTKLITENLLDAVFFNYIVHYYIRNNHLNGVGARFEAVPGGGSTTCDVVKHEIMEERRFCLIIVDSDKKHPSQHDYGDTASKIVAVKTLYPSWTCKLYVMEKVMEVENLIPSRIVKQYASDKTNCDVLDKDFSFFDMKEGVTLKGLFDDDVFGYLSNLFPELDYTQRNEAKNHSTCRGDYERYIANKQLNNVLKSGFGSDLLKNVTCSCDDKGNIRYPKLKDEMMNKIEPSDLTVQQKEEWDRIGEILFSWTCGLIPKIL